MKKILTIISGTALAAAAVVAVVALTASGAASAQDATTTSDTERVLSHEATDTITALAEELIDTLVAEGVITDEQADLARSALGEFETKLDELDWDTVRRYLDLAIEQFRRELENADWGDIQNQLEDALGDLDSAQLEQFDFDPDSIDLSELEERFGQLRDELDAFNLDRAREELERHLGDVDWDDLSSKFREELERLDFEELKGRADQLMRQFDSMGWDELRKQVEDLRDLSANA